MGAASKITKKDKKDKRATVVGKEKSENESKGVNNEWIGHLDAFFNQIKLVAHGLVA